MVAPVLNNVHCHGLGNDARSCSDGVVVERGVDADFPGTDDLHGLLLVLGPSLKQHGTHHAALVQHDHVIIIHRRAGMEDHMILQPFHTLSCGTDIYPVGIAVYDARHGLLVGLRNSFPDVHLRLPPLALSSRPYATL